MFILVLKKDRLSEDLWTMLSLYRDLLGPKAWQNFTVVITGVDFDDEDEDEYNKILEQEIYEFNLEF
jgi:hypothetical protein